MSEIPKLRVRGDEIIVEIASDKCKICPKGVGGAEIEGTLCLIPNALSSFTNSFLP